MRTVPPARFHSFISKNNTISQPFVKILFLLVLIKIILICICILQLTDVNNLTIFYVGMRKITPYIHTYIQTYTHTYSVFVPLNSENYASGFGQGEMERSCQLNVCWTTVREYLLVSVINYCVGCKFIEC